MERMGGESKRRGQVRGKRKQDMKAWEEESMEEQHLENIDMKSAEM